MAMTSIGEAFSAASGFLGLGARLRADAAPDDVEDFAGAAGPLPTAPDAFDVGAPVFEAVARALTEAGYLDS